MSWSTLHSESERLAIEAQIAHRERKYLDARVLYRQAAQAEHRALEHVDSSKSRTRGVTAVSAVALYYKAAEFTEAERLAHLMLGEPGLPDFARKDLRDLVQAIWTESAKREAGLSFVEGQVLVSVKGGEVVTGGAPLDLIIDKVQTIQSMFYRTIESLKGLPHRRAGAPSKEIQESCRPWLFQSVPGSYQFAVAIQKPSQPDFFREEVDPETIAQHFLRVVGASSRGDSEALLKLVPEVEYRRTLLRLARNLTPTGKAFERVELRGSGDAEAVALDRECRISINAQLKGESESKSEPESKSVELIGSLRAVHLDKDWLELDVDARSVMILGLRETVDDVIGPMVNRSVKVQATKTPDGKFKFVDIELAE